MTRSKWFGLWNNSEEHYMISQPIKLDEIKKFVNDDSFRLIIKKNKFYEKGGNKPFYCFAIGDVYSSANNKITSKDMQYNDIDNYYKSKIEELRDFIENENAASYRSALPSESYDRYCRAWETLHEMVEELTDTKIDFGYWSM